MFNVFFERLPTLYEYEKMALSLYRTFSIFPALHVEKIFICSLGLEHKFTVTGPAGTLNVHFKSHGKSPEFHYSVVLGFVPDVYDLPF
jgi:hypothetical protein